MRKQPCTRDDSVELNLRFIRHGRKSGEALSTEGQYEAKGFGKGIGEDIIASASDINRARITASLITDPYADIDKTFVEYQDFKREKNAPRVRTDKKLGFYIGNPGEEFYEVTMNAFKNNDCSRFYINDSDKYLEKDPTVSTYSVVAGNFAEIILKYCRIRDYADDMKNGKKHGGLRTMNKDGKIEKFNISKDVNRLFVSHAGTLELLLYKVIEDKEGKKGVEKFIKENHLEKGVDFLEGYTVKINKDKIELEFRGKTYEITQDFLQKLVKDRDELIGKKNTDK